MEKSGNIKKDYEENQENPENNDNEFKIPSKEFNDFISIINKSSFSLKKTISYTNNYFLFLELKLSNLIQQIDYSIKINTYQKLGDNEQNMEEIENKIPKNFFEKENIKKILYYFEVLDKHLKLINDKRKEYDNIKDLIIKEIKNKIQSFKIKKIKLSDKFKNFLNNTLEFKFRIYSIIKKNISNLEKLKIENDSNELEILQNYLSEIENKYNLILLELKELNEDISSFITDTLNRYLELTLKKDEEILKEQNKLINNIKKNNSIKENYFFEETKKINEISLKELKSFNSIKINQKKKSLLSHLEESIILDPEYILLMENFGNKNKEEENNNYNKEELIILKTNLKRLKKSEVVSDLNNVFTILGNNSDRQEYLNLCLHFLNYSNSNSLSKKEKNYNHFKYYNFDNFIFANNLFKIISHNITKSNNTLNKNNDFKENFKYYKILYNIINLGEKSFIENKYMCSLLKNNKFVEDINNIFKCELISSINNQFIEKDKIDYKQNVIYLIQNKLISSYENIDYLKRINIDIYIEKYKNLSNNEKNNFNNYELPKIIHDSMKKYLFQMAIYSISVNNALDFIKKISNNFPFIKDEYSSFYLNYYKSSLNSIKCQKFQSKLTDIKLKKKIKYIKQKLLNKKVNQRFLFDEKEINEQKKLILILKNINAFLNYEDKRKLLCLNKKLKISKYIYRKILEEKKIFFDITKHLNIWKIILGCSKMKKMNYLCKDNEEVENYRIIVEDIKRTTIKNYINKEKEEKSRNCLINILCSFFRINSSKIQYCQGMNFLVAFLYDLTNNKEEDTFSLFSNLVFNTELSKIYDIKFETLKCYFYILNRLIFLFLPQISQKFEEIKLSVDCFACPYFITLFTNTYIISNSSIQFMMFIIDNFIFKGWRIIFSSILSLLKYNEKEILEKEDDEVFNFVVNDIIKSNIFQKENFDNFLKLYKNFYIKGELIDSLKNEFNLENKIKKDLNIFVDI